VSAAAAVATAVAVAVAVVVVVVMVVLLSTSYAKGIVTRRAETPARRLGERQRVEPGPRPRADSPGSVSDFV